MALTLQRIGVLHPRLDGPDDWVVLDDGHEVGRILKEVGRKNLWIWANGVKPNSGNDRGATATLEEAKAAFKARWDQLSDDRKKAARR